MAQRRVWIGSQGPIFYNDTSKLNDSNFPGQMQAALVTDGLIVAAGLSSGAGNGSVTANGLNQVVDSFSDSIGGFCEWLFTCFATTGQRVSGRVEAHWNAATNEIDTHFPDRPAPLGAAFAVTLSTDIYLNKVRLILNAPVGYSFRWLRRVV